MARPRTRRKVRVVVRRARDALARDEKGIMALLVGGLAGFMMNTKMVKDSDWLREHWYALPIAMLLIGYMLAKRRNPHGKTLMALGGYLFMSNFMNRPKSDDTAGPDWDSIPGQWVVSPDGQRVLIPNWQFQGSRDTAAPSLPQRTTDAATQMVDEVYART